MLEVGVPVYKAQQTLGNLLDSLCVQIKKNFIVTLCIDGDDEDYSSIINTYRARGLKIKLLRCDENHGAGSRASILQITPSVTILLLLMQMIQ